MPKTPSNKLFRLIKSLSGSEKRYFKIFINNKGGKDNKYIKLFNAIEQQEIFNDEQLQQIVYPNEQVESRKYSELKAYLYDNILKSLQAYDEKSSVNYRIKGMLLSVRSLYKRSLFNDCKELLHKVKKIATKYEDFNAGLEILRWEKQIAYAETDITYLDKELARIAEEENLLLDQIQNISKYRNMFFDLMVNLRKNATSTADNLKGLPILSKDNFEVDIEKALSYREKVLICRVDSIYYVTTRNSAKSYQISKYLLSLLESKKYMINEDASEYIAALSNHIVMTGKKGKFDEIEETLGKFKKIKTNTIDDELKIYRQYYLGKFRLYIELGEFEKGYEELQDHLKTRKKFELEQFKKDTFYIKYFSICFGVEKYGEALEFLNEWLNMPRNIERKDLQGLARILNLIIHYEMQNFDLIESLIRSAYRYLNDKDFYSEFEKLFLHSLREASELTSRKERKEHWQSLLDNYTTLRNEGKLQQTMFWFPIGEWLLAKASGQAFSKVVKSKNQ